MMANMKNMIKRLQMALAQKGCIIRMNTYQFYSEEQERFITGYILVHRELQKNKAGRIVLKDKELLKTCSQIEVIRYLAMKHQKLCEGKNEETETEMESLC